MHQIRLKQLELLNFKNYETAHLNFHEKVICFTGNNGEGKTNVLDAIYYLCFCKSFINTSDGANIRNSEQFFTIQSEFSVNENIEHIYCAFKRDDNKVFKRNKKEYQKLSEHIGLIPLVITSPSDIFLIHEGSEIRRKFIDGIISQYDVNYLHHLLQYNKALAHRNALLKQLSEQRSTNAEMLEMWDHQLIQYGSKIFEARKSFITDFITVFKQQYQLLSKQNEEVDLIYESKLLTQDYAQLLKGALLKDFAVRHTTVGIHKDDLEFLLADKALKKMASQGQQKTFLLALRLAQYHYIKQVKKAYPILLVDDVYDKLDPNRVRFLFELITQKEFGQVFITDTNPERINKIFTDIGAPYQMFEVENGNILEKSLL
jgi:DNA replication and repair protein RecF